MARRLLSMIGMRSLPAPPDPSAPLRVEVIDELGRVLEAVYVAEITGGSSGRGDQTPAPRAPSERRPR